MRNAFGQGMVTRWDTVGQRARRDILVDDRTGTNHRISPHGHFRANRDATADADVIFRQVEI